MKTPTIESLRKQGWKVFVKHHTNWTTHIYLTDTEGNTSLGIAICHDLDHPNRKIGNLVALGRAIKNYNHNIYSDLPLTFKSKTATI
jgi:hypothetical protein